MEVFCVSLYDQLGITLEGVNSVFCFSIGFAKALINKSMTIEFFHAEDKEIKTMKIK